MLFVSKSYSFNLTFLLIAWSSNYVANAFISKALPVVPKAAAAIVEKRALPSPLFLRSTTSKNGFGAATPADSVSNTHNNLVAEFDTTAPNRYNARWTALVAVAVGIFSNAGVAFAEAEPELAELPPVWVPVLFSIFLLGGVGLLTGSLGNVMDEEALLGMQSGARAKKEIERSRSSYFKKK